MKFLSFEDKLVERDCVRSFTTYEVIVFTFICVKNVRHEIYL